MSARDKRGRQTGNKVTSDSGLGRYVPSDEPVYDSRGNRVDQEYIERAVGDVHRALGRPSLSRSGGTSPTVSFRLPASERARAEEIARQEGKTVSDLAREALERYLVEHPGA